MLYYTVTYRALPSGFQQTVIVAAPAHQTTLTGLNKYTNYSITVFASTCKDGNVSAPIFIVTDEDSKWHIYDVVWACASTFIRGYVKQRNGSCLGSEYAEVSPT